MAQGRVVPIDCDGIVDWNSFHDTMIEAFGFPGWYGRNMNAWVDLMTYLDEDQATTRVFVETGEILTLDLRNAKMLHERCPEIYDALIECSAFVNWRRVEAGGTAHLCLAFGV